MKIKYTSYTHRIDIETGEEISKEVAHKHYKLIQSTKTKYIKNYGHEHTERVNLYTRRPQQQQLEL